MESCLQLNERFRGKFVEFTLFRIIYLDCNQDTSVWHGMCIL